MAPDQYQDKKKQGNAALGLLQEMEKARANKPPAPAAIPAAKLPMQAQVRPQVAPQPSQWVGDWQRQANGTLALTPMARATPARAPGIYAPPGTPPIAMNKPVQLAPNAQASQVAIQNAYNNQQAMKQPGARQQAPKPGLSLGERREVLDWFTGLKKPEQIKRALAGMERAYGQRDFSQSDSWVQAMESIGLDPSKGFSEQIQQAAPTPVPNQPQITEQGSSGSLPGAPPAGISPTDVAQMSAVVAADQAKTAAQPATFTGQQQVPVVAQAQAQAQQAPQPA